MRLTQRLVEAPPTLAWHRERLASPFYRRAFGVFGAGSNVVRLKDLHGTARIHVGGPCTVHPDIWLAADECRRPIGIGDGNYVGQRARLPAGKALPTRGGCFLPDDVLVTSTGHQRQELAASAPSAPVFVGDPSFLGQRVTVLGGVTIGDGATVAAHSVATKHVRSRAVAVGVPVREIRQP